MKRYHKRISLKQNRNRNDWKTVSGQIQETQNHFFIPPNDAGNIDFELSLDFIELFTKMILYYFHKLVRSYFNIQMVFMNPVIYKY